MNTEIFVENVKKYCMIQGVTPTAACRESGVGRSFMTNLEHKGSLPSVEKVQLLANYLGVTTSELLGESLPDSSSGPPQPYLVMRYNSFPPSVQQEVMAFIEFKAAQLTEQEMAEKKDGI